MEASEEFKSALDESKAPETNGTASNGKSKQLDPQLSSMEEDWKKLKLQNQLLNNEMRTTDIQSTLNSQDLPLPVNKDGSLSFFWIDA